MDTYPEAIRQAVRAIPVGSRRLKAGDTGKLAARYSRTTSQVRKDIEKVAKKRNSGRAF